MRDIPTNDTTAVGIDIGDGGGGIGRLTPCGHVLCWKRCFGSYCERHTDYTPDFGDTRIGARIDDIPAQQRVVNTVPASPESDGADDDPTPALACRDCAVIWPDAGTEWAFCPRCGSELDEWEVADA